MSEQKINGNISAGVKFAFFGTPEPSAIILEHLKNSGFIPSLIITGEDQPKGRDLVLTSPEVKVWAEENGIAYIQPKTLRDKEVIGSIKKYGDFDFFVLVVYGKILPKEILDIPKRGIINVHPSLLPKLRGPSPIKGAILSQFETGTTIMKLDSEVDHGPILAQKKVISWKIPNDIPYEKDLEKMLAEEGGKLLAETLPKWIDGKVKETEQDHSNATFTKKIEKSEGELDLNEPALTNLRKIRAFHRWPTAYFFRNGKRIIVKRAHIENDELILDKVIPEGKKEMSYSDFLKGQK